MSLDCSVLGLLASLFGAGVRCCHGGAGNESSDAERGVSRADRGYSGIPVGLAAGKMVGDGRMLGGGTWPGTGCHKCRVY